MPTIRLQTVINRWTEGSFFAYSSSLPPAPTVDDVHRRIIAKGTFDKADLSTIISHYNRIDTSGVRKHAELINKLYRRLDDVGQFTGIKPRSNRDVAEKTPPAGTEIDVGDAGDLNPMWYDPTLIFGSCGNDETDEDYFYATRYDNEGYGEPEDTGYEIEFLTDVGWSTITLRDSPPSTP